MRDQAGRTVSEAGEAATIATIRRAAPSSVNGDDAAVLEESSPNSRQVCTTDILVRDRHFSFEFSTPYEVGQKAVAQNFADIQAMGGRPTAILLGIATPGDVALSAIGDIARGIHDAAGPWGSEIVGGDVVMSKDLVISLTAIGELAGPSPAMTLDGAAPSHRLIAAGPIGYSAAGLAVLQHYGSRKAVPTDDPKLQQLVDWHCAPHLPAGRGSVARATGASSMTDNSDGLVVDLSTIAERSGVTIDVDPEAIAPDELLTHAGECVGMDPWKWVLTGGEDHTLLGTTGARLPSGYRVIGTVLEYDGEHDLTVGGTAPAYSGGWESL